MLQTQIAIFLVIVSTVFGSIGSLLFKLSANTLTTLKEIISKKFIQSN